MRGKGIINFSKFLNLKAFLFENRLWIFLLSVFFIGLFFGIFLFEGQTAASGFLLNVLSDRYAEAEEIGFFKLTFDTFLCLMLPLVICFMSGASAFGSLIAPTVTAANGLFFGFLSACLYSEFSLKGVAFYAVIILPAAVINIIAVLSASAEAIRFSLVLARLSLPSAVPTDISHKFKDYCLKFLPICVLSLLSALVHGLLTNKLSDMFGLFL